MAIAVNGGHISRALDFYNTAGKYFIVGGTNPWTDESDPPDPAVTDYKLTNVVGLKKVDNIYMVVQSATGTISYRNQKWKIINPIAFNATVAEPGITAGSTSINLSTVTGLAIGAKLRINNLYEGTISSITNTTVVLSTAAPSNVAVGSLVEGGAKIEGARYVYVDCYLNYDDFKIVTYRQLGLCTGVTPNSPDIMYSAAYSDSGQDEYTSLGVLEVLDNRIATRRDASQRELLSLIIEF